MDFAPLGAQAAAHPLTAKNEALRIGKLAVSAGAAPWPMAGQDAPPRSRPATDMADQGIFDATPPDAAALLAACRQRTAEAQREVAQVAEALAANRRGPLTDRQRAQLANMLRRLVGQIENALHHGLAAALDARTDLRRVALAEFSAIPPEGAYDRFVATGLLYDPALVEAALHRMFEHMLETALRPAVADPWNQDSGLGRLPARLSNDRTVAERLNGYVVERAERSDGYGEPVLRPDEIEPEVIVQLHWRIAAVLRARAAEALGVTPDLIDPEMARVTAAALAAFDERAAASSATARAVAALAEAGTLEAGLVLEALRQAEVPLFVALVARLAGLRPTLARRLLFEPDGLGLAILARAIGLGADQLAATFRLTRHARSPARPSAAEDGKRLLELFERIAAEDAVRVCDHWRLPSAYLDAVWRTGEDAAGARNARRT